MTTRKPYLLLLLFLVSSAYAKKIDTIQYECLEHLEGDSKYVDSIVVSTNKDTTVAGSRASVDLQLSRLYVMQTVDTGVAKVWKSIPT